MGPYFLWKTNRSPATQAPPYPLPYSPTSQFPGVLTFTRVSEYAFHVGVEMDVACHEPAPLQPLA